MPGAPASSYMRVKRASPWTADTVHNARSDRHHARWLHRDVSGQAIAIPIAISPAEPVGFFDNVTICERESLGDALRHRP